MSTILEFPVAVIGGGPAGTAAAIELRRLGCEVIVFERSLYGGTRAGESVPPPARQLLRELEVPETVLSRNGVVCHGVWSAWGSDEVFEKSFLASPYGYGWHVDRRKFDEALAEEAELRGAQVLRESRITSCQWAGDHWRLVFQTPSRSETRYASFLIDASGRSSAVATGLGVPRTTYDHLLGVAQLFRGAAELEPITLVEAADEGWWYSAPLPDGALIVVYLTDPDLHPPAGRNAAERWAYLYSRTRHTVRRTAGMSASGARHTVMADTYRVACSSRERWLNAGTAAIGVDPLSSDGICFALRSGGDAARAVAAYLRGDVVATDAYIRSLDDYFARYLEDRCEFYRAETRWPHSPFWSRRSSPHPEPSPPYAESTDERSTNFSSAAASPLR